MTMMIKIKKRKKIIEGQNSHADIVYKVFMIFWCLVPLPSQILGFLLGDFGQFCMISDMI